MIDPRTTCIECLRNEDPVKCVENCPHRLPKPTVQAIGMVDARSKQIHLARAQLVADFFGMDIILTDKGNREEMTFISGKKRITIEAIGGVDGGFFGAKRDEESK